MYLIQKISFSAKLLVLFSLSTALSACSTANPRWFKIGVSAAEASQQHSSCKYEVGMNGSIAPAKEQQLVKHCMEREGYRWLNY